MGPTCAGKSTMINYMMSLSPTVGAVQIGKMMRAKYGEAHFKGQAAPSHTQTEALEMYFTKTQQLINEGKELILIDGQPRDLEQSKIMSESWKTYNSKFLLITADHDVRENRARKDREPGPNLDLAIARLTNDYKSCYIVIVELIKRGVPITVVDTSDPDYNNESFCRNLLVLYKGNQ